MRSRGPCHLRDQVRLLTYLTLSRIFLLVNTGNISSADQTFISNVVGDCFDSTVVESVSLVFEVS